MGKINYRAIYNENHDGWKKMTENPGKYEALLAGHYSDSNHFVYELLQNAEDAGATSVVFEYHDDRICFYHDGKPFDEVDVIGVSSMLETTKADDAQTIGKFGMGFKSVFKYTCEPIIYSDDEAFCIKSYLLPEEIEDGWDYKYQMKEGLQYHVGGAVVLPFVESEHLTKVELPFQKRNKSGSIDRIDGSDIILKLKELEPEILLFLKHIKTLLWVDETARKYERFIIMEQDDPNLVVCQLQGNASMNSKRYTDLYFYKYTRQVHHELMGNAEVSLAFLTNTQQKSIQKIENPNLWVFFPTKDKTGLPCLLHGSFETAVSREKLMRPSAFNDVLLDAATGLFVDAVLDFRQREFITQNFIRQILMTAFADDTLPSLKSIMTKLFNETALIPVKGDALSLPGNAIVSVPFGTVDLESNDLFKNIFVKEKNFVILNDEKSAGFSEYYSWLRDDLKVQRYSLLDFANDLKKSFQDSEVKANYDLMQELYEFLDDYKLSDYVKESKVVRKKSAYEEDLQLCVKQAWAVLRVTRILINAENDYIAAYDNDKEQVYLSSTSEYQKIAKSAIILSFITDNYKSLLEGSFGVREFDNFQYVKEKILVKYSHTPKTVVVTEDFTRDYADDILQICRLMMSSSYVSEIQELVSDRCVIMAKNDTGETIMMRPGDVFKQTSTEGADLYVYYQETGREIAFLEEDFYKEKGISIDSISKLGITTTPVVEGPRSVNGMKAIGEFRPYLDIKLLRRNIEYIQEHSGSELAKKKSACILKIALANANKMEGQVLMGNGEDAKPVNMICKTLEQLRRDDWLYAGGNLSYIEDVSKNQLDKDVYRNIELTRYGDQCRILGFMMDETEKAFDGVDNLNMDAKEQLLRKLAKELGVDIAVNLQEGEQAVFNPDDYDMEEFPEKPIRDRERLNRYVENQFYSADPIRYKEVVVKQKVNDAINRQLRRSYVQSMYTNQFGKIICQSCRRNVPERSLYAVTLANFGIEMEQLNLCLCPNCYQKYEGIKKTRSDEYKESLKRAIEHVSIEIKEPSYRVDASKEMPLFFTQTHLAELQNIFTMLDKYGVPMTEVEIQDSVDKGYTGGKLDEIVVHDGEMIEYESLSDMKKHQVELDVDRYPLHKVMDGRPLNVSFEYKGEKYRITRKL